MKSDYLELVTPLFKEADLKLQKFVQIPSVLDLSTRKSSMPFGNEVDRALQYIGYLATQDGFKVDYCDGYATEISYGSGPVTVGIYAHADVVPATGKWDYEPFGGEIDNGVMYGRGTSDDKGPGMAAYFAVRALKEAGLINNFKVVLVFGGNEENGSQCLDYYFHILKKPAPTYGFTPDADFPLIYGEKGISNYLHFGKADLGPVKEIDAGTAPNLVIDEATVILALDPSLDEELAKTSYDYEIHHSDVTTLKFFGKSAHGSTPEEGVNAGLQLFAFLGSYYHIEVLSRFAELYKTPDGKALGHFYESKNLGPTTYNVGVITYKEGRLRMTVNFRYPETINPREVINQIGETSPLKIRLLSTSDTLYYDPKSEFVQTLLRVYQEETGDYETMPKTIGGGTYAKEAPNTIAFGSAFPGSNTLIHAPNENIELEHYHRSMAIYAHAIYALGTELCD